MSFGLFLPKYSRRLPVGNAKFRENALGAIYAGSLFGSGNYIHGLNANWKYERKNSSSARRWRSDGLLFVADDAGGDDDAITTVATPVFNAKSSAMTSVVVFTRYIQSHYVSNVLGGVSDSSSISSNHSVVAADKERFELSYIGGNGYDYVYQNDSSIWDANQSVGKQIVAVISSDPNKKTFSCALSLDGTSLPMKYRRGNLSYIGGGYDGVIRKPLLGGTNAYTNYYHFSGIIHAFVMFNRFVCFDEAKEIASQPGMLFERVRPIIYNFPSAAIPTLSLAGVQDITASSARPKVTLTF